MLNLILLFKKIEFHNPHMNNYLSVNVAFTYVTLSYYYWITRINHILVAHIW